MKTVLSSIKPGFRSPSFWLVTGFLFWLSWACADDWNHNPNYSYGWLILPLTLYFLIQRFWQLPVNSSSPTWSPPFFWLYPIPVLVALIELARLTPFFWRPLLWGIFFVGAAATLTLTYRQGGQRAFQVVAFPILFLALAIPWPTFIELSIIRQFSIWIAAITGEILLLLGIFAQVQGRIIALANGAVGVEEACSGLRSLQASLMVGLAVGEHFWLGKYRRLFLLAISILGAFILNLIRTLVLSLLVHSGGNEALDRWHDPVGLVTMVGMTVLIFWIGSRLSSETKPRIKEAGTSNQERLNLFPPLDRPTLALSLATLTCFLIPHLWFSYQDADPSPQQPFLEKNLRATGSQFEDPPDEVRSILRYDSGGYFYPRSDFPAGITGYQFFWKASPSNGKVFFHRPDVCMPGGGWKQIGPATIFNGTLNGRETYIHRFHFTREDQQTTLYWIAWADQTPIRFSGSPFSNLQLSFIPEFIRLGKRTFSVEIAGFIASGLQTEETEMKDTFNQFGAFRFIPGP